MKSKIEKKENKKIKENTNKNDNVIISQLKDYFQFYNTKLKKKHIIVYVISLIIFFVFLSIFISSIDVTKQFSKIAEEASKTQVGTNIFIQILKDDIFTVFLVIFAGITPFVYLPAIGFIYPYILAGDIAGLFSSQGTVNLICTTLGCIIKIFGIALAMVSGFEYCKHTTKKFRYSQSSNFGVLDVKRHYYEIKNDEENVKKIDEQKTKKQEKQEKLNVKVPYKMLLYSFVISSVILIIGTIISNI